MSLTALAEKILAKAKELDQRGVVDPDSKLGFRNMTMQDYRNRAALIETVRELEKLSLGPLETLHDMASKVSSSFLCDPTIDSNRKCRSPSTA